MAASNRNQRERLIGYLSPWLSRVVLRHALDAATVLNVRVIIP